MWADATRFRRWLEIELLATEAHAALGVVPAADAARLPRAGAGRSTTRSSRPSPSVSGRPTTTSPRSSTSSRRAIGPPAGSWIHYGLTSSDVVDTALCWAMRDAGRLLVDAADDADRHGRRPRPPAPRHGDDRPHPRHPRRADDVRRQGRAVGAAARPRPRPAARGARTPSRCASCPAPSARTPTSTRRSSATSATRLGLTPGAGDPGDRP